MSTSRFAGAAALALTLIVTPYAGAEPTARSAFPVIVGKVTLTAKPTRIISLSPTATEDLFAIGAGAQVVAVDNQSNYPAKAPHSKLSGYTPNAEAIAAYQPDLVVVSTDADGLLAALARLKIPALLQPPAANLTGMYAQLSDLGKATGHAAGAAATIASLKRQIASLVASVPKAPGLSFYEELSPDYYSATSTTFAGQALKLLGLRDIADAAGKHGSGYPKLSGEYIVSANPDLIVLADTTCCRQTPATVEARAGWSSISAVKGKAIVPVSDDIASRWGPRIVDFMRAVAAKIRDVEAGR